MAQIVYSRKYDIRACGLEKSHLFDTRKYSRSFHKLKRILGADLDGKVVSPRRPVGRRDLLAAHTAEYLARLGSSAYLAEVLEVPQVERIPAVFVQYAVLRPMRWACAGTLLAGELALKEGFAVNLSGGYHHARPDRGEGFCVYSDIALLVAHLRNTTAIGLESTVAYVDVDAHQGNGVCHCFLDDESVAILDMFNQDIYPAYDEVARERVDCPIPIESDCTTERYLTLLESRLVDFLDSISGTSRPVLLIYNAGTDVLRGDPLGLLAVSAEGIIRRDMLVAREARDRGIPLIMLLSGGYTNESHAIIADSVAALLRESAN